MTLTVHRGSHGVESDVAIAAGRVRERAIAAENVLHDIGAISMVNSDSMGMGRIAETARRTWQLAHVQAHLRRRRPAPTCVNNERVLRYLAKITLNPAIAHGMAHDVGSLAPGPHRRHRPVAAGVLRCRARDGAEVRLRGLGRDRVRFGLDEARPSRG